MRRLSIDLETFSSVDLGKSGVYSYSEAPDFTILLLGYAWDEEAVRVVDLARGEEIPKEVLEGLSSQEVQKTAYNANFERVCLKRYLGVEMPPQQWQCTAVWASMLGLPRSLEAVGEVLRLQKDEAKDKVGKSLIRYFCMPYQVGGEWRRHLPEEDLEKWEKFKDYCKQDVRVEGRLRNLFERKPVLLREQCFWEMDQRINDRGVQLDRELIEKILVYDKKRKQALKERLKELTGITQAGSLKALKEWLRSKGVVMDSLEQRVVRECYDKATGEVKEVLGIKLELGKTSIKKYEAMIRSVGSDGRLRGCLQFYGAGRSGRWAGRLVQLHNLPQTDLKQLKEVREWVKQGEFEKIEGLEQSPSEVLSRLIRTMLVPKAKCQFVMADFSAIEARILAWLAEEEWRIEVFEGDGKIYEASASHMFGVPMEEVDKKLRQRGKVAELACGYGGGVGALKAMGGEKMGLTLVEMTKLIEEWRMGNPQIVKLWKKCEEAAREAITSGWQQPIGKGVVIGYDKGSLWIHLPSGRKLRYCWAYLDGKTVTYEGITQAKKWGELTTYGGKWVENIVQAIARDCLAEVMWRLEKAGYEICLHVHDEVVMEVPVERVGAREEIEAIMEQEIEWAEGLKLRVVSETVKFYKK